MNLFCRIFLIGFSILFFISVFSPGIDFFFFIDNFPDRVGVFFQLISAMSFFVAGILLGKFFTVSRKEQNDLHVKDSAIASCINGIVFADLQGCLTYVNQSFLELWGYKEPEEVLGKHLSNFYPYEERKKAQEIMRVLKTRKGWRGEIIALKKDKTRFFSQISASVVCDPEGEPICLMNSVVDITNKKQAEERSLCLEQKLRCEKQKLEQVLSIDQKMSSILRLNHLVDFIIEKSSEVLEADKCSLMLLDEDSQELIIRGARGLDAKVIRDTRVKVGEGICGAVAKNCTSILIKNIIDDFPGQKATITCYRTTSFMAVPLIVHGKLIGVVNVTDKNSVQDSGTFSDIDLKILNTIVRQAAIAIENADYYRKLEYLSNADSITGLYNHRHFIKCLDKEISRVKRYPKSLCLLMVDVNDFKSFNDRFGHLEGDSLLKEIGSIICASVRSIDVVCRYSGDQFAVILPETNILKSQVVAKKISRAVSQMKCKQELSLSIGIANYTVPKDRRDLICKADRALQEAKLKKRTALFA